MADTFSMHFFRQNWIRRITLLILLTWVALTQLSTVYACETENGKKHITCCCDKAIKKDCKHQDSKATKFCDNNSVQGDSVSRDISVPTASECCEITYGVSDATIVGSNNFSTSQVALLDAPQPPPLLLSQLLDIKVLWVLNDQILTASTPFCNTHPCLRTQRLRI